MANDARLAGAAVAGRRAAVTPEQFARVEQLFDAACRLPQRERTGFVNRQQDDIEVLTAVCALLAEDERGAAGSDDLSRKLAAARGDADVKQRVLEKLAAGDEPFLSVPKPSPASQEQAAAAPAEGPGSLIGPYKLLQQLGEGGFGVVSPPRRRARLTACASSCAATRAWPSPPRPWRPRCCLG